MTNLAQALLERNTDYPDGAAYIDAHGTTTYGEMSTLSRCYAGWFVSQGLEIGDRVMILMPDSARSIAVFLGAILAGGIAVPTNARGRAENIQQQTEISGAKFVITAPPDVRGLAPITEPRTAEPVAFMLWTSGTTGHSKAVMHGHASTIQGCQGTQQAFGMQRGQRLYQTTKFHHCYGFTHNLLMSYWAGGTALLDPDPVVPARIRRNIEEFDPDFLFSVPVLYSQLCSRSGIGRVKAVCVSAGDRLPPVLIALWLQHTGQHLVNQLGNTEMLIPMMLDGMPVAGNSYRIVDSAGEEIHDAAIGHLQAQGPCKAQGYWQDEYWTQRTFTEWFTTGDLFYRDAQSCYHHVGRTGDVIKTMGNFINPSEIEDTLQEHPTVEQAAVVARHWMDGIDRIEAYVVAAPGQVIDMSTLRRWVLQQHERHACPRKIHVVDSLPRTDSGKVQRFRLRHADPLIS